MLYYNVNVFNVVLFFSQNNAYERIHIIIIWILDSFKEQGYYFY
jgi:hypothetical protein